MGNRTSTQQVPAVGIDDEPLNEGFPLESLDSVRIVGQSTRPGQGNGAGVGDPLEGFAFEPPIKKRLGDAVIEAKGLFRIFDVESSGSSEGTIVALQGISLMRERELYPIREGEFVMIRGSSGGGKTTLLNILGALDKPSGGELELLGNTITSKMRDNELSFMRLKQIGFVFQTFNLLPSLSACENVELPMLLLGELDKAAIKARTLELLSVVGLSDRAQHLPSELSGGEQQRVAIARALANAPKLLLLDEPTGSLHVSATVDIMNLLLDINLNHRTTCIMVTHNPDLECYADRILFMQDGKIISQVLNYEQVRLTPEVYMKLLEHREKAAIEQDRGIC
mmetsp:Transcript_18459/g.32037  ORF Transcript_18459/g.32037 Transcript_18459/m.32037 type:complete len:339 (-) Transcript_18459:103-1119(-)